MGAPLAWAQYDLGLPVPTVLLGPGKTAHQHPPTLEVYLQGGAPLVSLFFPALQQNKHQACNMGLEAHKLPEKRPETAQAARSLLERQCEAHRAQAVLPLDNGLAAELLLDGLT